MARHSTRCCTYGCCVYHNLLRHFEGTNWLITVGYIAHALSVSLLYNRIWPPILDEHMKPCDRFTLASDATFLLPHLTQVSFSPRPPPDTRQFASVTGARYPGVYQEFLGVIDVLNFDMEFILSTSCVFRTNDFYDRLLISTIGPLVLVVMLAFTYAIALARNDQSEEVSESTREAGVRRGKGAWVA